MYLFFIYDYLLYNLHDQLSSMHSPEVAAHQKKKTLAHTVSLGGASYLDVMLYFTPSVYFDISRTANDLLLNMVIAKTQYHPPGLLAIATKGRKSLDV